MTFAEFRAAVKTIAFPKGEARNLIPIHDDYIKTGLLEIQRWVPCFRAKNTTVSPACSSLYRCGISVFDLPDGYTRLTRVFTADKGSRCGVVDYLPWELDRMELEARHYRQEYGAEADPAQHGATALPLGFLYSDTSTDSKMGRAVRGWYAVKDNALYVWPFVESLEDLIMEWEGIRVDYALTDHVYSDRRDVQSAVRLYLRSQIAAEVTCNEEDRAKYGGEFANALATLVWECRQKTQSPTASPARATIPASVLPFQVTAAVGVDAAQAAESQVWAVIGDYGSVDAAAAIAVAAMVKSWGPAFVVTTGDNSYPNGSTIDAAVGRLYRKFIYPYIGSEALRAGETAATTNQFWPALGNHDWDLDSAAAYFAYFTLPNNQRYYTRLLGNVQIFVVDSGYTSTPTMVEPDGNTATSPQADWLRFELAASTASWRVVVFHHPPYSNGATHGSSTALRWDFKGMGADLVLNGHSHNYERLVVDGLPYVVCGASGTSLVGFSGTTHTVVQYSALHGACRVTSGCDSLVLDFVNTAGVVVDTLTLTK